MRRSGTDDLVATGKGRRGRAVFQLGIEHSFRAARNANSVVENYYWSRGGLHVAGTLFIAPVYHRHYFSFAIGSSRTNARRDADADAGCYAASDSVRGNSGRGADLDRANAVSRADEEEVARKGPSGKGRGFKREELKA